MSPVTGFSGAQIESVIWGRFANQEVLSSVIWSLQVHLSRSGPTTSDGCEVSRVGLSQKLELVEQNDESARAFAVYLLWGVTLGSGGCEK